VAAQLLASQVVFSFTKLVGSLHVLAQLTIFRFTRMSYNVTATAMNYFFFFKLIAVDCLCGLVLRVCGYSSRGPRFDSRRYRIFCVVVGLEWVHSAL
jgi:hypothetical protein